MARPAEGPCSACTQGESSWHSPPLEIRIPSSLLLEHFHSLGPEGLEVHHTHLAAPLGNRSALEVRMKAQEDHRKVQEDHRKALGQNMSACRMVYLEDCRMAWEHCRRASEHHKLVCNLGTRVFQAPSLCLCPCYGGFSM